MVRNPGVISWPAGGWLKYREPNCAKDDKGKDGVKLYFVFLCLLFKNIFSDSLFIPFRAIINLWTKKIKLNLPFRASILNSHFALTLGYLNSAFNNPALIVKTSVTVNNSTAQDYTHPNDHIPPNWVFISIVLYAVYLHVIPDVCIHGVPWTSLTWPILCVLSPVFNVDICCARDNKFQLACIKEINQLRIQNLKTEKQDTLSLGSTSVYNSLDCALCLISTSFQVSCKQILPWNKSSITNFQSECISKKYV